MRKDLFKRFCNVFYDHSKVFAIAVITAVICTVVYAAFFTDIYRDTANVYAMCARALSRGDWQEGVSTRVPMLNILLGGFLAFCGLDTITALVIVSCGFYIAVCFPLRSLLLRYTSPLQAAYGCLLYAAAPKMIRFCCSGLLESSRIFFMLTAVLFLLRTVEKPNVKNASLFGVSAGLLMVARGEGLPLGMMLLAAVIPFAALFRRPVVWKKLVMFNLLAVFAALVCISPFCAINYSKSGYFVTDMRAVDFAEAVHAILIPAEDSGSGAAGKPAPTLTSSHEGNRTWGEKFFSMINHIPRGGYELYMVFAAIGVILAYKKHQLKSDHLLLLAVAVVQTATFFLFVSAYRYYLFLIPLFMMFTISGLTWVHEQLKKYLPERFMPVVYCGCGILLLFQVFNGLERAFERKDAHYREYGKWLSDYGKKHYPGRRMRLIAIDLAETAYWSDCYLINAYDRKHESLRTIKDFDLMILHKENLALTKLRDDLEVLPGAPESEEIAVFKLKPAASAVDTVR